MKLLWLIGQEDNGKYVAIRLDHKNHDRGDDNPLDPNPDETTGIIEPISPEEEAEELEQEELRKKQDLGDLGKTLKRVKREAKDEVS